MVEITEAEHNKEYKVTSRVSETSGTISNAPHSNYRGPRRRREKERV